MEPACAEVESPRLGSVGTGRPLSEAEAVDVGGSGDGDFAKSGAGRSHRSA